MRQIVEKLKSLGRLFTTARCLLITGVLVLLINPVQAEKYYFHNDHLGTPQVLTDKTHTVVWKGEYDPFGQVTETVALVEQNLRFPGQYFDLETGLHYNYFRSYDPISGRYLESDPIGLAGGLSTYGYVENNLTLYSDRYGLNIDSDPLRGPLYGTWVHTRFTTYVREMGLAANSTPSNNFGLYRPDAFNPESGAIGELKPSNCAPVI